MKIAIITQNDPFYTKYFFDEFVDFDIKNHEIVGVYFLSPMNDSLKKLIKRTYSFYGPINFVRMGFKYVFVKIGEKMGLPVTAKNMLKYKDYEVRSIQTVNDPEFIESLKDKDVDIILSVSAPEIFKSDLLNAAKVACINIHTGKIPKYRGLFPNFWQMMNDEKYSTISVHKMEQKIDKGNLIVEEQVEITPGMTLTKLIEVTKRKAVDAAFRAIDMYERDDVKYFENDDLEPGYFKFPGKKDVAEFRKKGLKIL